jgi:hypothetical protein
MIFRVSIIIIILLLLQLLFCNSLFFFFPSQFLNFFLVFVFMDLVVSCFRFLHGAFSSDLGFFWISSSFLQSRNFILASASDIIVVHSLQIKVSFPSPLLFCSVKFPFWWWISFSLASPCFRFLPCAFSSHLGSFFQSAPPFLQSGNFILHSVLTRSA